MDPTKNNPNKSKWIERHKHEAIVSQYKAKIQNIIGDYNIRVTIQSQRIDILMDTIRQQKEIIDSFVLNRRPIELDIIEDGMNFESLDDIHISDEQITHENQCKHNSKQNLEPSAVQCKNKLQVSNDEVNDAILVAINIQPNVKRFECNLCDKSFLSKRVLIVSIEHHFIHSLNRTRLLILMFNFAIFRNTYALFMSPAKISFVAIVKKRSVLELD